jgi:hypothetical protein
VPASDPAAPAPRAPARVPPGPARRSRRSRLDEAPPAPWGSFPLVELCVLIAIVLIVLGAVSGGYRGRVELACGLALGSLGGLEVSIREHFAGYRSHTAVLSLAAGVIVLGILFFAKAPWIVEIACGVLVFGVTFRLLQGVFRRKSGVGFRA